MSKDNVTVAVIAAAGLATRMWPASKTVPKELFPVGRVPAIVHLVWEFLDAGVNRIVVVVSADTSSLMRALFDPTILPPKKVANDPLVKRFQQVFARGEVVFIEQPAGYGNGIPLLCAAGEVRNVPCIYAFGDDLVFGENISRGLLETFGRTGCPVLAAQQVELCRRSQFGIIECRDSGGTQYVTRIIEKPGPSETDSNLAAFGRYLVTPDLMDNLKKTRPGRDGEVWFVDSVIQRLDAGGKVCAFPLQNGKWYTVGDPTSYASAVVAAQEHF